MFGWKRRRSTDTKRRERKEEALLSAVEGEEGALLVQVGREGRNPFSAYRRRGPFSSCSRVQ